MSTLASRPAVLAAPDASGVEFGRSAENFPVARLDDLVLAMLPARGDGGILASAFSIARPLGELKRSDFYIHQSPLADEAAFRSRVFETAEHRRELRRLSRTSVRMNVSTPWGGSQAATVYAEGVISHSTASHGGFALTPARNAEVPDTLRIASGWYEEDCDWAAVAIAFPQFFTAYERRCAERTIKDWRPEAWEAIFGRVLAPGESREKDRLTFEARHAGDWIVIAAIRSRRPPGMVEVTATRGGKRELGIEKRHFLVPSDEYTVAPFGFVVDEERHAACDGASSFIGESRSDSGP